MNILLSILDCIKIMFQALRYGVVNIPTDNSASVAIKAIGLLNPFFISNRKTPHGLRIRNFLESLGPMFIKFGQLLSTRTDAVSVEITTHLKGLTDQCNPFSTEQAKEIIEKSLNIKIDDVFEEFEDEPLAAASLAQVHRAKLKSSSERVVIKVLRPGIHKRVKRNVRVMKAGGFLINLFYKESDRLKLKDVINLSLIHISEPTRLLSISYAVFCLKKKKNLHTLSIFQLPLKHSPSSRYFHYRCTHLIPPDIDLSTHVFHSL